MAPILKNVNETVLLQRKTEPTSSTNPMIELKRRGLAVPTGNGLFALSGEVASLFNTVDLAVRNLAASFNAQEWHLPTMLSVESAVATCYVDSFAHQAVALHQTGETLKAPPRGLVGMASPTVCYPYFAVLQQTEVRAPSLVTAVGACTRFEAGILENLGRLLTFTMREIIGVGTEVSCAKTVKAIKRQTLELFNERFDLSYELTTASDPFFGDQAEFKKKAQLIRRAKEEIRTDLPFKKETLAAVSFNFHEEIFFKRFSIKSDSPEPLESFCVGYGYERIVFSILSQKGTDFQSTYYRKLFSETASTRPSTKVRKAG